MLPNWLVLVETKKTLQMSFKFLLIARIRNSGLYDNFHFECPKRLIRYIFFGKKISAYYCSFDLLACMDKKDTFLIVPEAPAETEG